MENDSLKIPADLLLNEVAERLNDGCSVTLRAKGSSMYPFIREGRDAVTLKRKDVLRAGDVVLARLGDGTYVLHRIVALNGDEAVLRGDGNLRQSESCRIEDVLGAAVGISRGGRHVDTSSFRERAAARLWMLLFPLRRFLLPLVRAVLH